MKRIFVITLAAILEPLTLADLEMKHILRSQERTVG
jgi:hypothetical protein